MSKLVRANGDRCRSLSQVSTSGSKIGQVMWAVAKNLAGSVMRRDCPAGHVPVEQRSAPRFGDHACHYWIPSCLWNLDNTRLTCRVRKQRRHNGQAVAPLSLIGVTIDICGRGRSDGFQCRPSVPLHPCVHFVVIGEVSARLGRVVRGRFLRAAQACQPGGQVGGYGGVIDR